MKYFSYVIPRNYGFAPNPYFGYCTLATCKPRIRKSAEIGDWIAAYGAASTPYCGKLVMLMKVGEVLKFDDYWVDSRFKCKRPVFNKGMMHAYGDNIYHHVDNEWTQEPSHHSMVDGNINMVNLTKDTETDRVLIAIEFYYFGNNAIEIPNTFSPLVKHGRNHSISKDIELVNGFINFIVGNYESGIHGTPYSRKSGAFAHYKGEK